MMNLPFRFGVEVYTWFMDGNGEDHERNLSHMIEVAAIALPLPWNAQKESEEEIQKANEIIELTSKFPALLCLLHELVGRYDIKKRGKNLIESLNSVARRAAEQGGESTFHPNSPSSSITRIDEDYDTTLSGLDEKVNNTVHYKDWDGPQQLALMEEEDNFTPLWMACEVAEALPNSELHLCPDFGHAFHWENIEDFNPRASDWL